jgi:uncharacterized membrane protein YagU involved in acid resistance
MNVPSILLWGLVATLVLSALMSAAQGLGLSRMSVPFLMGTVFTADRAKATILGVASHLATGWIFAFLYGAVFESLGRVTWWIGGVIGVAHGLVVLLVILPVVAALHPRIASEQRGPEPTRALEPPGFLGLHYGRRTPLIALAAHVIYGMILGGGYRLMGG